MSIDVMSPERPVAGPQITPCPVATDLAIAATVA